jgi:serine/threonine protein kinase
VLHRDVKPGNIFLCDGGRVVLADFGIATRIGDPSLTASAGLVGSPGYMAPERLCGDHAGPPSDLWSLGPPSTRPWKAGHRSTAVLRRACSARSSPSDPHHRSAPGP